MSGRHGYGKERFIGPRCKPIGTLPDEYGIPQFLDYCRACKADGCMVRLTSDTRAGANLLCIDHGREYEREKAARLKAERAAPAIKAAATRATPEWQAAAKVRKAERELRALLKRAIPAPPAPPPPPPPHPLGGASPSFPRPPSPWAGFRVADLRRDRELKTLLRQAIDQSTNPATTVA